MAAMAGHSPLSMKSAMKTTALLLEIALLLVACAPRADEHATAHTTAAPIQSAPTITQTADQTPTTTPTSQPTSVPKAYGPDPSDFPPGVNPLSGQVVADPSLLRMPAVLISISHFPPTARPQAGLSFAPYVFEFSITEGQSRFLAVFYGEFPAAEVPLHGDCVIAQGPFQQTATLLGGRVWLDENRNGMREAGEGGLGGVCVNLYAAEGQFLQQTTTDTHGYYGFNVEAGRLYSVAFLRPASLDFSRTHVGDADHDSDADPSSGRTPLLHVTADNRSVDAGLIPNRSLATSTPDPKHDPKPEVGPVRSGRLHYAYIAGFFTNSCLIYAGASAEVLPLIPHCSFVPHETGNGGEMLSLERLRAIAEDNMRKTASRPFNYASNVYADSPPAGGMAGQQLKVYYAYLNQSGWVYDPLHQAYLRYVDSADKNSAGLLHPDVDRLTGRQLYFENVIVLMADTEVVAPTILDIKLEQGNRGYAYLFRDGQMYPIRWSTLAGEYERKSGFRRPIRFLNQDGSPAPLKPGHTWVVIVTPFSYFQEQQNGVYLVRYAAPAGEAR